ncbi:MAG: hypothetical protein UT80_C0029G0005 [Parcubacteria group bacterium GW2011_GWC1_40_13]|nr:MAG: hypothetical protein UT80_C0029G0005 [Parcubacteria group bacterium GW2011_GWC1_40_13]
MPHNIPTVHIQKHTRGISDTKRTEVANLQKYIQELLGDTHHTFLQGSYANDTSTSDINDVDIVAIRKTTYSSVHTGLSFPTSIPWETIFSEIETKLKNQNRYTWTVERSEGGKCIEVRTSGFKADVVPAVQINEDVKSDPIAIYSFKTGIEKVNRPRTHIENGVAKHNATNQNYKPIVRMFKNWVKNHFDNTDIISSYQVESLVYNTPNENFHNDHAYSFLFVGNHIAELLSQRDILPIKINSVCGTDDITTNWNIVARQSFKNKLKESVSHGLSAYKATTIQEAQNYWDKTFNI